MLHARLALPLLFACAAPAAALALPRTSAPQLPVGPQAPSALESARIDLIGGRAVLLGGGTDASILRRGDRFVAEGRAHLEVAVGAEVRVGWAETMTVDVVGPASLEWDASGACVSLRFHELSWADVETRRGEHRIDLPADWSARLGRSAVRLRGIAGGPTELVLHAGQPARVEWSGDRTHARPPVVVYPGSSVRLDRPRHTRAGEPAGFERAPWPDAAGADAAPQESWPWRSRTDTDADVQDRLEMARVTRRMPETPGAPGGDIRRVQRVEGDGSRTIIPLEVPEEVTYAQAPVTPASPPRFTLQPSTPGVGLPGRPEAGVDDRTGAGAALPGPRESRPDPAPGGTTSRERAGHTELRAPVDEPPVKPIGSPAEPADGAPEAPQRVIDGADARVGFQPAHWRGLSRERLNGAGNLAVERGSGVEVRILGGGRTKVFVSGSAPSPRWCFTPQADYLMQPGAVAVFEPSGRVSMSFGTMEEHEPTAGRPSFDQLAR